MATAVDIAFLAGYSSIPEANVNTLINQPTTDLVTTFLQTLIIRAQEHEALKAEHLRRDVELENAVRGGEAKARVLKANADKSLQEVESLRRQLNEQGRPSFIVPSALHVADFHHREHSITVANRSRQPPLLNIHVVNRSRRPSGSGLPSRILKARNSRAARRQDYRS